MAAECDVEGCDRPVRARGWCVRHYMRWQRHGDPTAGRRYDRDQAVEAAPPGAAQQMSDLLWPQGPDDPVQQAYSDIMAKFVSEAEPWRLRLYQKHSRDQYRRVAR